MDTPKINLENCHTANEAGKKIASIISGVIRTKPNAVIGLATGSSPLPIYKELIRLHLEEGLDFSNVTTFNLDEYYGLPPSHDQSYRYFMYENLFKHINIKDDNINFLDGLTKDIHAECSRFEEKLSSCGYCDVWLLGIGRNGHIAFNEPGTPSDSRAHLVKLTESTIKDNARFFNNDMEQVPKAALTSGIATIMTSKKIVVIATGKNKAEAVHGAVYGKATSQNPCSFLQNHSNATIYVDDDAAL